MLRQIKMMLEGTTADDGSLTISFVLTGIADMDEATALGKAVAPKLERAIVRALKQRKVNIYERRKPSV